jgi:hypothetical protein
MAKYELSVGNVKKALSNPSRAIDKILLEYSIRLPATLLNSKRTIGTNVYDRDWDVLILLDTCRVDALKAVADEYDFLNDIGSIRSAGGSSGEWIARTFDERHQESIQNTAYLTANAHARQILEEQTQRYDPNKHLTYKALRFFPTVGVEELGRVEPLYQYEPWGEDGEWGHKKGMTPPRYVTERAISIGRDMDYDRMILHYFQPHSPWVANALSEDRELNEYEDDWWNYLARTGDVETVWDSYLEDLRYVLDDVELLLKNLDADTVAISADHGEAFGEYGVRGHEIGSLHPKIRTVPWVETSGVDEKAYTPTIEAPETESELSPDEVEEQLCALGYKT